MRFFVSLTLLINSISKSGSSAVYFEWLGELVCTPRCWSRRNDDEDETPGIPNFRQLECKIL